MTTCKECIHYEACRMNIHHKTEYERFEEKHKKKVDSSNCSLFKDRSKFIELSELETCTAELSIDEAIDYCYSIVTSSDDTVSAECKAQHLRLCGLLGELKRKIDAASTNLKPGDIVWYYGFGAELTKDVVEEVYLYADEYGCTVQYRTKKNKPFHNNDIGEGIYLTIEEAKESMKGW